MLGLGITELLIASVISTLQVLMWIFVVIYLIYTIYYRKKFLTINLFEDSKSTLPGVLKRINKENVIQYARNFTYKNQFYLTNMRFVFFHESILMGKSYTKFFKVASVKNTEIEYKNPYGWLIYSGINFTISIPFAISAANKKTFAKDEFDSGLFLLILFASIIYCGLFVLLWYYLKGYYLILDNGRISGLFCRSSEGLENTIRKFDLLNFSEEIPESSDLQTTLKSDSKDMTCSKCKSIITLEGSDLEKNSFQCPVCGNVNPVIK